MYTSTEQVGKRTQRNKAGVLTSTAPMTSELSGWLWISEVTNDNKRNHCKHGNKGSLGIPHPVIQTDKHIGLFM
jgi:hypothetical protein